MIPIPKNNKARASELIRKGRAYIDYGGTTRDNNPLIDILVFETYGLVNVGNNKTGVLRYKSDDGSDPVIYIRINNEIHATPALDAIEP